MRQLNRRKGIKLHCGYQTRLQILAVRDDLRPTSDTSKHDDRLLDLFPGPPRAVHTASKCLEWVKGEG